MDNIENEVNILKKVSVELVRGQQQSNKLMQMLIKGVSQAVTEEVGTQIKTEMINAKEEIKGEFSQDISTLKDDVGRFKNNGIDSKKQKILSTARSRRIFQLLGNKDSDKYIVLNQEFRYQMFHDYKIIFDVKAYDNITNDQFDEALEFIKNWRISFVGMKYVAKNVLNKYQNDELKPKERKAYEKIKEIFNAKN